MKCMIRKVVTRTLLLASLLTGALYHAPAEAATLLPNGEQTFVDQNGLPIAGGCVYFYQPGTATPKDTYLDAGAATTNTNPVVLDSAGRAIIYGVGTYRQVVQKASSGTVACTGTPGEQMWDQLTADSAAGQPIYAGASGGTPNAVTLTAAAFTGTDGQVINYVSTTTNTAAATANPSGFGAVQIVRDSATGPGALTGGELVATNAVSLIYDATAGTFHILSPVTWPNTSGVPVGTVIQVAGFTAPTNYAFSYGQAINRTAFASLMANLTLAQTGTIASGSAIITGLSDTTQLGFGMPVESIGIAGGATLLSCTLTSCTMSANATTSRSGTMTFFPYGNGDGSLTFNLPDYRGMSMIGRDNLGGTAANVLQASTTIATTSASASATVGSATGLAVGMFILNTNVTPGTTITAISGVTITMSANATATASANAARFSPFFDPQGLGVSAGSINSPMVLSQLPTGITSSNAAQSITVGNAAVHIAFTNTNWAQGNTFTTTGTTIAPFTAGSIGDLTTINGINSISVTSNNTSGTPLPRLGPHRTVNYAIRLVP